MAIPTQKSRLSYDSDYPYYHAIWHLFVLAGSIFHFFAVLFYVIPVAGLWQAGGRKTGRFQE